MMDTAAAEAPLSVATTAPVLEPSRSTSESLPAKL